jgi:membrane-anchored protein YejM (alkaline phosphatase superfamily)
VKRFKKIRAERLLYLINGLCFFSLWFFGFISAERFILSLIASQFSLFFLLSFSFHFLKRKKIYAFFVSSFSLLLVFLHTVHFVLKKPLDVFFVFDNVYEIFSWEGLQEIVENLPIVALLFGVLFFVAMNYLSRQNRKDRTKFQERLGILSFFFYLALLLSFSSDLDPFSKALFSALKVSLEIAEEARERKPPKDSSQVLVTSSLEEKEDKPHVFIIFWESLSNNYRQKIHETKGEYTPFYKSLTKKGIFFDHFYGNSIQTSRGQFATLCSKLPSSGRKIFKAYAHHDFTCLSDVLKTQGYTNLFFKAYRLIDFDNTRDFMERHNFDHIKGMSEEFVTEEDKKYIWGWGLQDDVFYKKYFRYLDKIHENGETKGPYFTSLTTVSSHMSFENVPYEKRELYPNAKNIPEHYGNAIRLSDDYLKIFFEELGKRDYLKNSIVVILGDHSWPLGEHGYYYNIASFFEEFYRTSAVILWPNHIKEKVIKSPSSQLDIAPTLLDLLGIEKEKSFMGSSGLDPFPEGRSIYQIQPYSGSYLGIVRWPYKYVYHKESKNEFFFDLENDKMEEKNLFLEQKNNGFMKKFQDERDFLLEYQRRLKTNTLEDFFLKSE